MQSLRVTLPRRMTTWLLMGCLVMMSVLVLGGQSAHAASYADAMKEADGWCGEYDPKGYIAISGYGWLTAADGGTNITVEAGATTAPVTVNFAGRHCANSGSWRVLYMTEQAATIGKSGNLLSGTSTMVSWPQPANHPTPSDYWVKKGANLNISSLPVGTGTYSVCMHWVAQNNYSAPNTDVTTTCTDITITKKSKWSINGQSYVRKSTAKVDSQGTITANPGDVVYFSHDLRNDGPEDMDRDIYYNVDKTGFTAPDNWDSNKDPTGNAKGTAGLLFVKLYAPNSLYSSKTIRQSDVGAGYNGRPEICERIAWKDKAWDKSGEWGWSIPSACVKVPYVFDLTPTVTIPSDVATAGSSISTVTPKVMNAIQGKSVTRSPDDTEWQLKRIEVPKGGSIPTAPPEGTQTPCDHYSNGGKNKCIDKGSNKQSFGPGSTPLSGLNGEIADASLAVGTKICYVLSVRPYDTNLDYSKWRYSVPECLTVGKLPKVQVWGNDVRTHGSIETGISTMGSTGAQYGSWVEYGSFSVGSAANFASGAGLNNGKSGNQSTWSQLTFANRGNSYGNFALAANFPVTDLVSQFSSVAPSGAPVSNVGSLASGTYSTANDLTISSGGAGPVNISQGKSIIVISSGTVTIGSDITYKGNGNSDVITDLKQMPQLIIIAKHIVIADTVGQVDAWLLTHDAAGAGTDSILTCSKFTKDGPYNSAGCGKVLQVNGPISTSHLYLVRTGGTDPNGSAEVFNLRPDAYLWGYLQSSKTGKAETVSTVELPPRF